VNAEIERAARSYERTWRRSGDPWRDPDVHEAAAAFMRATGEDHLADALMAAGRPPPWRVADADGGDAA